MTSGKLNAYIAGSYSQIASGASSTGTINVQGGEARFWRMTVGDADKAEGYLNLSGDGKVSSGFISVANRTNSTGVVSVADTAALDLGTAALNLGTGTNSSGTLTVLGGTVKAGTIVVGLGSNSNGILQLSNGEISVGTLSVGNGVAANATLSTAAQGSVGKVTITGGALTITGSLNIAPMIADAATEGHYSQSGGVVRAKEIYVGSNNNAAVTNKAVLTVSGGALTSDTFFNVGASTADGAASAQATITGTGSLTAATVSVMRAGTLSATNITLGDAVTAGSGEIAAQTFMMSNGSVVSTARISNSNGVLNIRGGSLSATELVSGLLQGATSVVSVSGGDVNISTEISMGSKGTSAGSTATYTQSNGTVWAKQATLVGASAAGLTTSAVMNITGGKLTIGNFLTMSTNSATGTNTALVTVGKNGTLEAGRINIFGGATLDVSGMLQMIDPVSGSNNIGLTGASASNTANLIVRDGATVSVKGNLNFNAHSRLTMEVGDAFNTVNIGGLVAFNTGVDILGTQKITLDFSDYTGGADDIVLFSTSAAITGFEEWYATASENLIILGLDSSLTFKGLTLAADKLSITATLSDIPEPAVAGLLCGLLALAAVARRKRS